MEVEVIREQSSRADPAGQCGPEVRNSHSSWQGSVAAQQWKTQHTMDPSDCRNYSHDFRCRMRPSRLLPSMMEGLGPLGLSKTLSKDAQLENTLSLGRERPTNKNESHFGLASLYTSRSLIHPRRHSSDTISWRS